MQRLVEKLTKKFGGQQNYTRGDTFGRGSYSKLYSGDVDEGKNWPNSQRLEKRTGYGAAEDTDRYRGEEWELDEVNRRINQ